MKKVKWICLAILLVYFLILLFGCINHKFVVHAEEPGTDSYNEQMINYLTQRMQEMGIQIDEINQKLQLIDENDAAEEEQRISMSDKLDLLVIGMEQLVDNSITELEALEASGTQEEEYRAYVSESLDDLNATALQQSDNTVSGNMRLSDLDDTIRSSSEDSRSAYTDLFTECLTYVLVFIGIVVGAIVGAVVVGFLKHDHT